MNGFGGQSGSQYICQRHGWNSWYMCQKCIEEQNQGRMYCCGCAGGGAGSMSGFGFQIQIQRLDNEILKLKAEIEKLQG